MQTGTKWADLSHHSQLRQDSSNSRLPNSNCTTLTHVRRPHLPWCSNRLVIPRSHRFATRTLSTSNSTATHNNNSLDTNLSSSSTSIKVSSTHEAADSKCSSPQNSCTCTLLNPSPSIPLFEMRPQHNVAIVADIERMQATAPPQRHLRFRALVSLGAGAEGTALTSNSRQSHGEAVGSSSFLGKGLAAAQQAEVGPSSPPLAPRPQRPVSGANPHK